jgi:hypothetical protein
VLPNKEQSSGKLTSLPISSQFADKGIHCDKAVEAGRRTILPHPVITTCSGPTVRAWKANKHHTAESDMATNAPEFKHQSTRDPDSCDKKAESAAESNTSTGISRLLRMPENKKAPGREAGAFY